MRPSQTQNYGVNHFRRSTPHPCTWSFPEWRAWACALRWSARMQRARQRATARSWYRSAHTAAQPSPVARASCPQPGRRREACRGFFRLIAASPLVTPLAYMLLVQTSLLTLYAQTPSTMPQLARKGPERSLDEEQGVARLRSQRCTGGQALSSAAVSAGVAGQGPALRALAALRARAAWRPRTRAGPCTAQPRICQASADFRMVAHLM